MLKMLKRMAAPTPRFHVGYIVPNSSLLLFIDVLLITVKSGPAYTRIARFRNRNDKNTGMSTDVDFMVSLSPFELSAFFIVANNQIHTGIKIQLQMLIVAKIA